MIKINTKIIQVKRPLSNEAKDDLLKQMSEIRKRKYDLSVELDDLKEKSKELKDQIEQLIDDSDSLILQYDSGFTPENVDCEIKYNDGKTQYVNVNTGEIEQEYDTTDKEQLILNNNAVDAEDIIRADNQ
jgi:chromosome segregation ATPase